MKPVPMTIYVTWTRHMNWNINLQSRRTHQTTNAAHGLLVNRSVWISMARYEGTGKHDKTPKINLTVSHKLYRSSCNRHDESKVINTLFISLNCARFVFQSDLDCQSFWHLKYSQQSKKTEGWVLDTRTEKYSIRQCRWCVASLLAIAGVSEHHVSFFLCVSIIRSCHEKNEWLSFVARDDSVLN